MIERLHLVDGTFELFRAHYSKRPDRPMKATLGVVDSLRALVRDAEERVTHLAVAFDNPIRSFRNRLFAGYKTEEGMEPILLAQLDPVEEAVRAAGFVVWSMDEFEADDALATAAAKFADAVTQFASSRPTKISDSALEHIPPDPAAWPTAIRKAPRLAATLVDEKEAALLYRRLATLRLDVALTESLDALRVAR